MLSEGLFNTTSVGIIENEIEVKLPDEFFSFVKYQKNTRSRLIVSNDDMFLLHGQNGLMSILVIVMYLVVWLFKLGQSQKTIVRIFIMI